MTRLALALLTLALIITPAHAQTDARHQVAPCVTGQPSALDWRDAGSIWTWRYYSPRIIHEWLALEGEQVTWLGYAPRHLENYWLLEREGVEYGFEGVNLDRLEPVAIVTLSRRDVPLARFMVSYDAGRDAYFVTATSFSPYARSDGTAYDHHILPHPAGGACMWWVDTLPGVLG